MDFDPINKPEHYANAGIQPIQVVEAWGLGFNLGNVIKYIKRNQDKGTVLQDLEKARWYLNREIAILSGDLSAYPLLGTIVAFQVAKQEALDDGVTE